MSFRHTIGFIIPHLTNTHEPEIVDIRAVRVLNQKKWFPDVRVSGAGNGGETARLVFAQDVEIVSILEFPAIMNRHEVALKRLVSIVRLYLLMTHLKQQGGVRRIDLQMFICKLKHNVSP